MNERLKNVLLAVGILAFGAVIAFKIAGEESREKAAIDEPSKVLVRALEANDPSAAPAGAEGYVKGVRAVFGRVRSARYLGMHTEHYGSGNNRSTDDLGEIVVRTKRGAAVLEVDFEGSAPDGITELEPGEVEGNLTRAEKAAVRRGFARRGSETAGAGALDAG
jgi:hypothetical protein